MSETEVSAAELSLGSTKLSQNCVRLSNVQQNWVQTKQCQVKTEWGWTIPVKSKLKQKCPIWNLWVSNVRNSKWASPLSSCLNSYEKTESRHYYLAMFTSCYYLKLKDKHCRKSNFRRSSGVFFTYQNFQTCVFLTSFNRKPKILHMKLAGQADQFAKW